MKLNIESVTLYITPNTISPYELIDILQNTSVTWVVHKNRQRHIWNSIPNPKDKYQVYLSVTSIDDSYNIDPTGEKCIVGVYDMDEMITIFFNDMTRSITKDHHPLPIICDTTKRYEDILFSVETNSVNELKEYTRTMYKRFITNTTLIGG